MPSLCVRSAHLFLAFRRSAVGGVFKCPLPRLLFMVNVRCIARRQNFVRALRSLAQAKTSVFDCIRLLLSVATIPTIRYPRQPVPPCRARERGIAATTIVGPNPYRWVRRVFGITRNILCVIGTLWIFHITWEVISGESL